MPARSYNLFCPLAMACEIIEPKWTLLILAEIWDGSSRFNDIRRGVPGISPTLLSRRLKEMEASGLIERLEDSAKGTVDYVRTQRAEQLEPIILALGDWAYLNVEAAVAIGEPNPDYLMWQMRRTIDTHKLPKRRVVVRFHLTNELGKQFTYWMIAKPGTDVDLCMSDPGHEVDVYIDGELKALTSAWMGYSSLAAEVERDRVFVTGSAFLTRSVEHWMGKCQYAEPSAATA